MIKLKIILKSKKFFVFLLLLAIIRLLSLKPYKSIFSKEDNSFICTVTNIQVNSKVFLSCGEMIESKINDKSIKTGDILSISGYLEEFNSNSNINLFNYNEYQKHKNIVYKLNITSYKKIGVSNDIILNIKRFIVRRIENLNSYNYLNAFLLGDKSGLDSNSINKLGIIHLFCVSGMHITFLISLIENNISNRFKNKIIGFSLFFYYLLVKSVSIFRYLIFMIVKKTNKKLDLNINIYYELLMAISIILILRPSAIYDIGFYYSVIISSGIQLFNRKIKIKNKIINKIVLNIYISLLSFPLLIYSSFEINISSIIFNIIFIPFVSLLMFPISLLTFLFPVLDNIFIIIINLFEMMIDICKNTSLFLIFMKPKISVIVFYYIIIFLILYNYKFIYLLVCILFIHYNYNLIFKSKYILFLNVNQGDSILIHIDNNNILIDTGGIKDYDLSEKITIPVLKSLGIRKLSAIITSHGDYDHMGESINLVNNFKVEKVVFNCGPYNDLEKELIKVLNKKKIKYYSCIKELSIDKNRLYFLQTKEYDNENDNSNVIYTELSGYKFMFMGDASTNTEKAILNKYNLPDIDVLKVGHHGSKTSSSKEFINEINPKYSIISVGKKNRYGHPNKEVLDNLKESKIYRTDEDGSIMFSIDNKLKNETCSP